MKHFLHNNKVLGFEDSGQDHLIPAGAVPMTMAEVIARVAQPQKTLAQQRDVMVAKIRAHRDRLRFGGGARVGTNWFMTTPTAIAEYNSMIMLGQINGLIDATVIRPAWRTMNDTLVDMTPALAKQILNAGFSQVKAIDDVAQGHITAVLASQVPTDYVFTTGWPTVFTS
jgi:hypothetical protein